jgi:acyl carrier protein
MNQQTILSDLTKIFSQILDLEDVALTSETHAGDIEEWDSLSHIQLIVAIEKFYKIKFTSFEIQAWKNVGDMVSLILQKVA